MLTADLVKVRRRSGKITPAYVRGAHVDALLPMTELLIDVFDQSEGSTVDDLNAALRGLADGQADRLLVGGLIKLLRDRCEIEASSDTEPEVLRAAVFQEAAARRKALGLREPFDRTAVLESCANALSSTPEAIEASLFADLPGAQRVGRFRPISALELIQRYNLALAQGVLLRATRVQIELAPCGAARFRQLFRAVKFRRLMHAISGDPKQGYTLVLDGPMSLFEATHRYGLQLALFLPVLVAGDGWSLSAELRWGKDRSLAQFDLSDGDGLVSNRRDHASELEEISSLVSSFSRSSTPWKVRREARVFNVKGRGVFVPDLVFKHEQTGQRVYLEAFGYWSRKAVFDRVELLERGFKERFILAVSRKLRVSDEIADDGFPGGILVYAQSISAHAVRRMLDAIVENDAAST